MSDPIKQSIAQIRAIRSDLLRYEASVPNAIAYLEWLAEVGYIQSAIKLDLLKSYLDTLSRFLKLAHHIDGNFPFTLFQTDETVRLMAWGYTVLYGDRLISYSRAAAMLGKSSFTFYRMVYPNTGTPLLTAYYDPSQTIRGHSSRVLIDEVQALIDKESK